MTTQKLTIPQTKMLEFVKRFTKDDKTRIHYIHWTAVRPAKALAKLKLIRMDRIGNTNKDWFIGLPI